jgi:two-component system, NarL family, response regulator LiaR
MTVMLNDRFDSPALPVMDSHSDIGNYRSNPPAVASATVRVMVVDDHPMFRLGVISLLTQQHGLQCVGEAATAEQALAQAPAMRPDVVLVDLEMPGADGISAIEALRQRLPAAHFVVIASDLSPVDVRRAVAAGVSGVMLKTISSQELVAVLHAAHKGQRMLAPEATEALMVAQQTSVFGADLTQRERKLLTLMAHGLPNQEISERLEIGLPTVKFHVTNILSKLHASNRTSAVLAALRHKLVRLDGATV